MGGIKELYQQLDPGRPLEADEVGLYVDWGRRVSPDEADTKKKLIRAIEWRAGGPTPAVFLVTGHRGVGKTTELLRVKHELEHHPLTKVFAPMLFAAKWLDIDDVQPEDLVLQIVRQLVSDLEQQDIALGRTRFSTFLQALLDRVKDIRPDGFSLGIDPVQFSFTLKDFPTARTEFREVLRGQLPTLWDLVNRELLPAARQALSAKGFSDIVIIVDELDKMPQRVLNDGGLTNHENLYLDHASTLRALSCHLVLSVPIELAYSSCQTRLQDDYGSTIETVPTVPVRHRDGELIEPAVAAMAEMLDRRARAAGVDPGDVFSGEAKRLLVEASGGYVRGLIGMLVSVLEREGRLPLSEDAVRRSVERTGEDLRRALGPARQAVLDTVAATKAQVEDPLFWDLLRNHFVFAYEVPGQPYWYDVNPVLRRTEP